MTDIINILYLIGQIVQRKTCAGLSFVLYIQTIFTSNLKYEIRLHDL